MSSLSGSIFAQYKRNPKPQANSKPKPDQIKSTLKPGGIDFPTLPGDDDPTGSCNICRSNHASFPAINWRNFTPHNTAFLCGDNGFLSVGFNTVHGIGLSPFGLPKLPYRYTSNVPEPSLQNRFYEGLGILAPDPTGSFGCNGIILLPRKTATCPKCLVLKKWLKKALIWVN